jgi:hypothetical protein
MTMQRLLVFQSMWGMERLRSETGELTLEEKVDRIAKAGFDGVTDHFYDRTHVAPLMALLKERDLAIEGQVFPRSVADLAPALEMAAEFGCHHITIQPDICPMTVAECVPILAGWHRMAADAGVPVYVETHRARMTNDLLFTMHLLDAFPEVRFTVDLSHYVVAREMSLPIGNDIDVMIGRILDHGWAMHGRVAGAHQVQVELSFPQHQPWFAQFQAWWAEGFRSWRQRADDDATLSFTCELGPAPYAISAPDGRDQTDRWTEALMLHETVLALWQM